MNLNDIPRNTWLPIDDNAKEFDRVLGKVPSFTQPGETVIVVMGWVPTVPKQWHCYYNTGTCYADDITHYMVLEGMDKPNEALRLQRALKAHEAAVSA